MPGSPESAWKAIKTDCHDFSRYSMARIDKYMAVGLQPTVWGAEERSDIDKNLEHIHGNLEAATWLSSVDLPVKLAVIPEGALQGFTDEVFDMDHAEYREEIAIDIPGTETDTLGEYAEEFDIYIVASAKEKSPDYDDKVLQHGVHHRPGRRGHSETPESDTVAPGRAIGHPPTTSGTTGPRRTATTSTTCSRSRTRRSGASASRWLSRAPIRSTPAAWR
jgi:hypothetical protein